MATGTPVPFGYLDQETELTACQPLISLSPRGRIACVRLNNRSMRPPSLPAAQAEALYAAYRAWTLMAGRPEFALHLRLAPGDCLIFDNTRVLHARTAFAAATGGQGERHRHGLPRGSGRPAFHPCRPSPFIFGAYHRRVPFLT